MARHLPRSPLQSLEVVEQGQEEISKRHVSVTPTGNYAAHNHDTMMVVSNSRSSTDIGLPWSNAPNAIDVRNLDLTYGSGDNMTTILTRMNITVFRGEIYALIGPSGCGKTSLLRCVMGFLSPDSGSIKVFGLAAGDPRGHIPGRNLGYMPQEIALNSTLTIYEMLRYFARIFNLSSREFDGRIDQLLQMLDIPDKNAFICTLSGGQKRRVSFACAVIHKPPLIILDEPTVGVDPITRVKMWEFLVDMAKDGSTILITTHYIEETRRANIIGFMRSGCILAEESPDTILSTLQVPTLEDAFYQLCLRESEFKKQRRRRKTLRLDNEMDTKQTSLDDQHNFRALDWFYVLFALLEKFTIQIWRDKVFLLAWMLMPVTGMVFLMHCFSIPEMSLAVVNEDNDVVSDSFLDNMNPEIWKITFYDDVQEAKDTVNKEVNFAYVHFYSNFSETILRLPNMYENSYNTSNTVFNTLSNIASYGINKHINEVKMSIAVLSVYQSMPTVLSNALREAGLNPRLLDFPVLYGDAVYGEPLDKQNIDVMDVKNRLVPSSLILQSCLFSMVIALYFMASEKRDNMFERTFSAGVSAKQLIVSQFVARTPGNIVSVVINLFVLIEFYGISMKGSLLWAILMMFIQSLAGLSYGMTITCLTTNPITFMYFMLGSLTSLLFLSGTFWPLEAQPFFIQWMSRGTPLVVPSDSLRSIMVRGLPFTHPLVYPGFLVSIGYFSICMFGAIKFFNLKTL